MEKELLREEILLGKSSRFGKQRWDCKTNLCYMGVNPPTVLSPKFKFDSHIVATLEVLPEKFCLLKSGMPKAKNESVIGLNTVAGFGREGLMQILLLN